jgi:hypothetical protein
VSGNCDVPRPPVRMSADHSFSESYNKKQSEYTKIRSFICRELVSILLIISIFIIIINIATFAYYGYSYFMATANLIIDKNKPDNPNESDINLEIIDENSEK